MVFFVRTGIKWRKRSRVWSYMLICSFSWSIFEFFIFVMIFLISGSLIQSQSMFFNTFDILEHHRNDPWCNWEKSFFHENVQKLGRPTFWWRSEKFPNVMKFTFQSDHRFWKLLHQSCWQNKKIQNSCLNATWFAGNGCKSHKFPLKGKKHVIGHTMPKSRRVLRPFDFK